MFANIRLKNKLMLSFLVVLCLLLLTSALAYKQFVTVGHEVEHYAKVVEGAAEASHIETQFLTLRTHAREYAAYGKPSDAKAVHEIGNVLSTQIEHALKIEKNTTHIKLLEVMKHDIQLYLKDFATIEILEHEYLDLVKNRLMPKGEKMTAELDEVLQEVIVEGNQEARKYVEEAMKHLFATRLYSNLIIGNQDQTVEGKARSEFRKLHETIQMLLTVAHTEKERTLANDIDHLAQDYEDTLMKVIKDTKEIHHLSEGEMAAFSQELIAGAEKLQEMSAREEKIIEEETIANIETGEAELLIVGALSFVSGLLLAWILGGALAKPIQAMTGIMHELADNNLSVDVPYTTRKDEMGEMASSVNHFKEKMLEVKRLEKENEEQKQLAKLKQQKAMLKMADTFESTVGKVVQSVTASATELQSAANQMAATALQTSQQATIVSSATEEASANVQTVAAASGELASSNEEIGRNVLQSAEISNTAAEKTSDIQASVTHLVDEVSRISGFAKFISEIAEQTNMLALNATIESARAGVAGKGFAVVASEVKALAQQTAKATEQIVNQISKVNKATQHTSDEMSEVSRAITEADRLVSSVAIAVEEQMAATQEIARSVEQASQGTQEVVENISLVETASNETGTAAEQIASSSLELSKQAEYLSLEVSSFLDQVRSDNLEAA